MIKNADLVLIATALRESKPSVGDSLIMHAWSHTVDKVIDALHATNPRMNVQVFKMACGVN